MERLLHWFAGRRRPDAIDEVSMTWHLFWRVNLVVLLSSDDLHDTRPAEHDAWWLVLSGHFWLNRTMHEPCFAPVKVRAGEPCNVQLSPSSDYEEGLFDLSWMDQPDIRYATDRRAWVLEVV